MREEWLRLVDSPSRSWQNRAHFFGAAAKAMHRLLIARARRKQTHKRGAGLDRFAALEPRQAELVKLRYFAGIKIEDAAEVLGISKSTAKRWWAYARAWHVHEIQNTP